METRDGLALNSIHSLIITENTMSARTMSFADLLDSDMQPVIIAGLKKGVYSLSKKEYDKLKDKTVVDELLKKHTLNVSTVVVDSGKGKNSAEQVKRIAEYGVTAEVAEIQATVAKIRVKCGSALVFYFK